MKFIKKYIHFIIPVCIIAYSVLINKFPDGYIYTSGDYAQPININYVIKQIFYVWGNKISAIGEGGFQTWSTAIPYYLFFYALPKSLQFTDSQILSYILFAFLISSYFSFYFAIKTLGLVKESRFLKWFSLLYPFNLTTLYFFEYTWGFSHHVFIYITIPIIFASFFKAAKHSSLKNLSLYSVVITLSVSGFTNAAFFAALALFLSLFLFFQFIQKNIKINKALIKSLTLLFIVTTLSVSYWLLPTIFFSADGIKSISSDGVFNKNDWLKAQSASIISIFIGNQNYKVFFPYKYGSSVLGFLALLPMTTMIFFLKSYQKLKVESSHLVLSFLGILIVATVLIKKSANPFGDFTLLLFNFHPLVIFRSYEKLAVFLPFIIFSILYFLIDKHKLNKKLQIIILVILISVPTPFFLGGIQKKYSITFSSDKNYLSSPYSSLISIPEDYFSVSNELNRQKASLKIQSLPYSPLNSIAWVNYPEWKLVGLNPADNLFEQAILSQNASIYLVKSWNPTSDLNHMNENPIWYIKMLSMFGVETIMYHKDVDHSFRESSKIKVSDLVNQNALIPEINTQDLEIYKINDNYISGLVYIPKYEFSVSENLKDLPYPMLLNDYTNDFSFNLTNLSNLNNEGEYYAIIEPIVSVDSINDEYWNYKWKWPDKDDINNPLLNPVSNGIQNIKQRLTKKDRNESFLDESLYNFAKTAIEINRYNLYTNQRLKREIDQDSEVIINLIRSNNESDLTEIIQTIKYFNRVNNLLNGNWDSYSRYIDTLYSLYEEKSECYKSKNYCFEYKNNSPDKYKIFIPKRSIGLTTNSKVEEINSIKFLINGDEREIQNDENKYHEEFIYIGEFELLENTVFNLKLNQNRNVVSMISDEKPNTIDLEDKSGSILTHVIPISEANYVVFDDLEPNTSYTISFDYIIDNQSISLDLIENKKTENGKDIPYSVSRIDEIIQISKNSLLENKTDNFKKVFTTNGLTNSGYIAISNTANRNQVGVMKISNLKVEENISPKMIIKHESNLKTNATPGITVNKLSPTKYLVNIDNSNTDQKSFPLILSETFNHGWKIRPMHNHEKWYSIVLSILSDEFIFESSHREINGYSNLWEVNQNEFDSYKYDLVIEFVPQGYFYIGILITSLTFTSSLFYILYSKTKKKVNNDD